MDESNSRSKGVSLTKLKVPCILMRADFATADFATADFATADFATADFATADFATADFATADFATADFATALGLHMSRVKALESVAGNHRLA